MIIIPNLFKNCAPFTNWINEINNKHVDDAQGIDIVMPIYNLKEYSDNYLKTSGSLWQYGNTKTMNQL